MKKLPLNCTLRYLYANGILPTVRNYIGLNWMGDYNSLDELEGEYRAEVEALIEAGLLVATDSDFEN